MNNFRHGLTGHAFFFLWENPEVYDALKQAFKNEHQPATVTEHILVDKMLQHHWLAQRAQALASDCTRLDTFLPEVQKNLNTFVRYQALHERLFKSALHDLLKLRAERRKEQIGFESQKRAQAEEERKAETHQLKAGILQTRLEREKTTTFVKGAAAAEQLERIFPPGMLQKAA